VNHNLHKGLVRRWAIHTVPANNSVNARATVVASSLRLTNVMLVQCTSPGMLEEREQYVKS
jgi:hypothetical protein